MNLFAIHHVPDVPFAYAEDEKTLVIRLRAAKGDLKTCTVLYKDRYNWQTPYQCRTMSRKASTGLYDFYETKLSIPSTRFRYVFQLEDKSGEILYLNERGLIEKQPDEREAFQYAYIAEADVFRPARWAENGVVYSIFPDRFSNGDLRNDPKGTSPWGEPVHARTVCGGDLQGIIDRLPYLAVLGVNILYLTPIYQSKSNHKYDIDDYFKVDPWFGDIALAKKFVQVCHENHIRVLFDAVFNHCGTDFFAFRDVLKNGASSLYKDWFFIHSFPVDMKQVNYETFGVNAAEMPKLNMANPEVTDYFLKFAEFWMKETKVDGWRLDVCDEVSHAFWRRFRGFVKSINPEALIIGEVQHEASAFLHGDELDATMNYPFREICVRFFARRNTGVTDFESEVEENRMRYMDAVNRNMFNVLDSHDTERFLTMCGGKKERLMCALAFQFTYIGLPYIFYGDEVGIAGGYDPLCRQCMIWDSSKQDQKLLAFYKALVHIRRENPCLTYGGYVSFSNGHVLAYSRSYQNQAIVVLINNSDSIQTINTCGYNGTYMNLLTGKRIQLQLEMMLDANRFLILKAL